MINYELATKIQDNCHASKINKLYWLSAILFDDSDLRDMISDISEFDEGFFKKYLPKHEGLKDPELEEIIELFFTDHKYGLLAEIWIPQCYNFSFKDGKPSSWSVQHGVCAVRYVYAETLESLVDEMIKVADEKFAEYIECDAKDSKKKPVKKNK